MGGPHPGRARPPAPRPAPLTRPPRAPPPPAEQQPAPAPGAAQPRGRGVPRSGSFAQAPAGPESLGSLAGMSLGGEPGPAWARDGAGAAPAPEAPAADETLGSCPEGARHVVEVHGFTPETREGDLTPFVDDLSAQASVAPRVEWVDDTHVLVVYATAVDAGRAVGAYKRAARERGGAEAGWPRARPAAETTHPGCLSTPLSRLAPARARQRTTSVLARRLIGGALGINLERRVDEMAAEGGEVGARGRRMAQERHEIRQLREENARARERQRAAQGEAWDG